jgi:hypothetical protein
VNPPPRQVVRMQMYETWSHVIGDVREFIRRLYLPERIEGVLGRQGAEATCGGAKSLEGGPRLGLGRIAVWAPGAHSR